VGAAADGFQEELVRQLKAPGRLFIPVEERGEQHIYVIDKAADGTVTRKKDIGVRYVPLTDAFAD
jgi:protein-L-isoaspartate(D-aspartate) O-methyltransferase